MSAGPADWQRVKEDDSLGDLSRGDEQIPSIDSTPLRCKSVSHVVS